ncbi:sugar ABC transporter substrate-binding protein [Frondihabitans sp. PAMC 28766]|uniref:extracellular solute-binding protein n=1 Tax=Frondihabitans sp. PAMC 28766 TaxID=1795630 RepID=UPI00078D19C3|nr:extracellular solute-binding protein [Frondihabitans sp. PAMC 28766]AMM21605.1 sugar ABC transporter substrate-binding protein [Frondihabitans sp. PAMC 28766]
MSTLRGITWEHPRGLDCFVAASAVYSEAHPGTTIEWAARSLQAFADAPLETLAREYDLLVIDHPHVPVAARDGLLMTLDGRNHDDDLELLAEQSVGRSHASYASGGHQYGLATDAAAQVSASRPDLIARPPDDWDGVLELAREGRVLWPAKPIDALSSLITIAGAHGASPVDEPGVFLRREKLLEALDLMHRLADAVPADCLAQNPIEVAEALAHSDRHCYAPLLFGYSNYARAGFRGNRLRYHDAPAGPDGIAGSLLGGAGIAVSGATPHEREALDFAFWVASAEAQRGSYFDAGGQPGNAEAWDDDRANGLTLDFFRDTWETLDRAWVRPSTTGWLAFQDLVAPWVTEALARELSDDELGRRLDEAAAELLLVAERAGS